MSCPARSARTRSSSATTGARPRRTASLLSTGSATGSTQTPSAPTTPQAADAVGDRQGGPRAPLPRLDPSVRRRQRPYRARARAADPAVRRLRDADDTAAEQPLQRDARGVLPPARDRERDEEPLDFLHYAVEGFVDELRVQLDRIWIMQYADRWEQFVYQSFGEIHSDSERRRLRLVKDLSRTSIEPDDDDRLPKLTPVRREVIRHLSPQLAELYASKTERTLTRDLNDLLARELIVRTARATCPPRTACWRSCRRHAVASERYAAAGASCAAATSCGRTCGTTSSASRTPSAAKPAPTANALWKPSVSATGRARRRRRSSTVATDDSTASPSAPPTCCAVLSRPDASPASSCVDARDRRDRQRHERQAEPDRDDHRRHQHVADVRAVGARSA